MKKIILLIFLTSIMSNIYGQFSRTYTVSPDREVYKNVKISDKWWIVENSKYVSDNSSNYIEDNKNIRLSTTGNKDKNIKESEENKKEGSENKTIKKNLVNDANNKPYVKPDYKNSLYYKTKCISLDGRYKPFETGFAEFNEWIINTLEESAKENRKAIIINKSEYTLYVIDSGKVDTSFFIELGFNPYDDKKQSGDGCTPEGVFYIAEKKPWSNFHKAFLISYPTIEDAERGVEAKLITESKSDKIIEAINNKETPDQNTKLGGLLEIHGVGSGLPGNDGGDDWTLGCVAISNAAIDYVFPIMRKGDIITIVRFTNIDF